MTTMPDDRFELPEDFGDGSVWADRVAERSYVGRNRRGVEIPIGSGEGQINPGELLKLALIGCAGMSADFAIGRRLGPDFAARLWAHGVADRETERYAEIGEQIQLDLEGLDEAALARLVTVIGRAIDARCTVQRTVEPGVAVHHTVLGAEPAAPAPLTETEPSEETPA